MEEEKNDELLKKRVDDAWKAAVDKEKAPTGSSAEETLEVSFGLFISGLMMEALMALGEVENPATKKKEPNLTHARFVIDTLSMLKDKTRNNLDKDETDALESILYDLRMRFVVKSTK